MKARLVSGTITSGLSLSLTEHSLLSAKQGEQSQNIYVGFLSRILIFFQPVSQIQQEQKKRRRNFVQPFFVAVN
jgi:hypothetical protein